VEIFREKRLAIVSCYRNMVVEGGYGKENKIKKIEKQKNYIGEESKPQLWTGLRINRHAVMTLIVCFGPIFFY